MNLLSMEGQRAQLGRQITISGFDKAEGSFGDRATKEHEESLTRNKIYLKDFDIEENEHFVKYVFIPYFKDIFKDL